jgi:transposase
MPRMSTVHAVTTIGIDMGKNTLHMIGLDSCGAIVLREKVPRGRIALRLANLPPCLIGIEAGPRREASATDVREAVSAGA